MDLGLEGRVYVLTGASGGLGFATARHLVSDGAHVVISGRDEQRVIAATAALNEHADNGGSALGLALDNGEPDTPARLIAAARTRFDRFDGALVSVGGPPPGAVGAISDDAWRTSFETIFLGTVRLATAFAENLERGGALALVLSGSVRSPIPRLGISNGLRPGLAGIAKSLADEHGTRGVRVLSLLPSSIRTERLRAVHEATGDPEAAEAAAAAATPLHRLGEPDEFGRTAAFLLSPAAGYITGAAIPVDGGLSRLI